MGLCKCPKKSVTNQFCFEHRVNVCEHCMVNRHPKCVVHSYLEWLQDSEYDAICEICTHSLGDKECIRLVCYDVFHWSCLDEHFKPTPRTTAPAGFTCPSNHCNKCIFPAPNVVSPVADVLRERLAGVDWARAGLGLPLLSNELLTKLDRNSSPVNQSSHYMSNGYSDGTNSNIVTPQRTTPVGASDDESSSMKYSGPPYSVVQVQDDNSYNSSFNNVNDNYQGNQLPRRMYESKPLLNKEPTTNFDHDEDKYKRKSALEWILRWWKNTLPPARNRRSVGYLNRKFLMAVIIIAIVVITVLFILTKIARSGLDNNPALDPMNNPHIQVDYKKMAREIDTRR